MSTHKHVDIICIAAVIVSLLVTIVFLNGKKLGIQSADQEMGYETRLFDTGKVHTIDIVMDDWDGFLETCENEEYAACSVVIDGEAYQNVGLRAKGNTSLRSVSSMGSDRYSFKIEFDQYDDTKSYYGLDKLCLNNLIQDNTYMKDYLTYQMMDIFGVDSPLCSYVFITVNGEDWGLYLAVEGVEDGFLQRNYGSDAGELYKPDSMSMGGGRGNGMDFDPDEIVSPFNGEEQGAEESGTGTDHSDFGGMPEGLTPPSVEEDGQIPENFTPLSINDKGGQLPGGSGGMGSSDIKLQYIDDDPDSYENIFENAKTDISEKDQERLIASLKYLSEYENIGDVVNIEEVLRYFVVHNFVVNGDSYTGSLIHNYYLYEKDGQLSMIPWDYNLAYGTFQGGSAASAVNDPIDDVLEDRPMQAWIFSDELYTQQYHQLFAGFLNTVDIQSMIEETEQFIASYVERDPSKFCTYEEFEAGVETLKSFCALRAQSVGGQLGGTIPSTSAGQSADGAVLVDTGDLNLSDMGTMGNTMQSFKGELTQSIDKEKDFTEKDGVSMSGTDGREVKFSETFSEQSEDQDPSGIQPPDEAQHGEGNPDSAGRDSRARPGNVPSDFEAESTSQMGKEETMDSNTWILLSISCSLLLAGILIAISYKRSG